MKRVILLAALLASFSAAAQPAPPVYDGSWIATAGPKQVYRGKWSGQLLPNTRNEAVGSWTLLNDANQTVLQGTWLAQKSAQGWQGTWSAQIPKGQKVSGTWEADMADFNGKTFEDMLKRTAEKQIAGWWHSGRIQGNWWLKSRL